MALDIDAMCRLALAKVELQIERVAAQCDANDYNYASRDGEWLAELEGNAGEVANPNSHLFRHLVDIASSPVTRPIYEDLARGFSFAFKDQIQRAVELRAIS